MLEAVKSDANIDSEIFKDERAQKFFTNIFFCLCLFVPMVFNLMYKVSTMADRVALPNRIASFF